MKYKLNIKANEGYSPDQVRYNHMTVADLKELLDGLEDDAEIVTFDQNNPRGASWGMIIPDYLEEVEEDEE